MSVNTNVGTGDRIVRVILGLAVLSIRTCPAPKPAR